MRAYELNEGVNDHYLYHGTDLASAINILRTNQIDSASQYEHNPEGVSLTREYTVAHDFGTMWDRQYPVVLVIDAQRLKQSRAKVVPRRDSPSPGEYRDRAEAEEMVIGDLPNLSKFLVSVNVKPADIAAALKDRDWAEEVMDQNGGEDIFKTRRTLLAALRAFTKSPLLNSVRPRIANHLDRDPPPPEQLPPQFTQYGKPAVAKEQAKFHANDGSDTHVSFYKKQVSASPDMGGKKAIAIFKQIKALLPAYQLMLPWGPNSATRKFWSEEEVKDLIARKIIDGILPHGYFVA
jgi:hypothetical protein